MLVVRSGFEVVVLDARSQIKATLSGRSDPSSSIIPSAVISSSEEEMVDA